MSKRLRDALETISKAVEGQPMMRYCDICNLETELHEGRCCNDFGRCADCGRRLHGPVMPRHVVWGKDEAERQVCSACRRKYDQDGYRLDKLSSLISARLFAELGFAAWLEGVRKEKSLTRGQTATWATFLLVRQGSTQDGIFSGLLGGAPTRMYGWIQNQQEISSKIAHLKAREAELKAREEADE